MTTDSQHATNPPLKAFFEPKTLTELSAFGHTLTISVDYEATNFDKTGLLAFARKIPLIKGLTPFKSPQIAMDIDLSCVVLDKSHQVLDKIWYGKVRGINDHVRYVGGLYGATNFEESLVPQESINIKLKELPDTACYLVFVMSSYYKHPLSHAKKGVATLTDQDSGIIYSYALDTIHEREHGVIAWVIERYGDDFRVSAPQKGLGDGFDPANLNDELDKLAFGF